MAAIGFIMRKKRQKIKYVPWYPPSILRRRKRIKILGALGFLSLALMSTTWLYSIQGKDSTREAQATFNEAQLLAQRVIRGGEGGLDYTTINLTKGQSLWEALPLLRIPLHLLDIYSFLEAFMRLNPGVKDISLIPAGQDIKVPLKTRTLIQKAWPKDLKPYPYPLPQVRGKGQAGFIEKPSKKPSPSRKVEHKTPVNLKPPSMVTPERGYPKSLDPAKVETSLRSLFAKLGEKYLSEGQLYLPIGEGGVKIDLEALPLVEVSSGRRLLLDIKGDLRPEVKGLIESNWKDYRIVSLYDAGDLASLLDRAISLAGYFAVKPGGSVTLGDKAKVIFKGDWLIIKREESLLKDNLNIVNLVQKGEPFISPFLVEYARKMGILINEVIVSGEGGLNSPLKDIEGAKGEFLAFDSGDREGIVDSLLGLLHQKYESEVYIPIIQDMKAGYSIEIKAGRLLEGKTGQKSIIDFTGLPEGLARIAESQGYKMISLAGENPTTIIKKVLDLTQVPYKVNPSDFWTSLEPRNKRIKVFVPGFVIYPESESPIIITRIELDEDLKKYLMDKGLRIGKIM